MVCAIFFCRGKKRLDERVSALVLDHIKPLLFCHFIFHVNSLKIDDENFFRNSPKELSAVANEKDRPQRMISDQTHEMDRY
jgi:hypothetical protein